MDLYSLTGGVSIEVLASTGNAGWVQEFLKMHTTDLVGHVLHKFR